MPTLAPCESRTIEVDPRKLYVPTNIRVTAGERLTIAATGKWADWFQTCDHRGWGGGLLTRFARVKNVSLFHLCGCIGRDDRHAFPIDTTRPWTVPDTLAVNGDHQLYLFANDWRWLYWNNRALSAEEGGPMRVTITRVA